MPRKFVKRAGRKFRKRVGNRKRGSVFNRGLSARPFADSKLVKLKYVDTVAMNAGAGAIASHLFRCNSIYDPDFTGIGYQPMGHDEYMILYDKYRVVGAKISATFVSNTTDQTVGIFMDQTNIIPAQFSTMLEQKKTQYRYLTAAADRPITLTKYWSAKKFFGKFRAMGDDNRAQNGFNPAATAYFIIFQSNGFGGDPNQVSVLINIEYIVLYTSPKQLVGS